jgi:2-oxoadipate dioxygenase/decarboxylase-like protein
MDLLDACWTDYVALTPQAERIHRLLAERGETVANDHVALRTFGVPGIGIAELAAPFEAAGWVVAADRYRFDDKKLVARYWRRPDQPKVFVSELCVGELSPSAQAIIARLMTQLPAGFRPSPYAGRPWRCTRADYEALLAESEYAAWVAAFGFRVNHFTVDVGALSTFDGLPALNAFLVANGFVLNTSGGAIKGTRAEKLEQSSTRADTVVVDLDGESVAIPSCYYEFARRYDGFEGFVPASADKIFESTNVRETEG